MCKSLFSILALVLLVIGCATSPSGQFAEGLPPVRDFETVSGRSAPSVLAETRDIGGGIYFGADERFHYLRITVAERGRVYQDAERQGWQMGEAGIRDRFIRIPVNALTAIIPLQLGDPDAPWQHFRDWRMVFDDPR